MDPTANSSVAATAVHAVELVRIRWGVALLYFAATTLAYLHALHVRAEPVLVAALITAGSNAALRRISDAPVQRSRTLALLLLDTLLLTAVLAATGGASNPLSAMYIVPIALAGLLLHGPWAWVLALLSTLAFGLLFFLPEDGWLHTAMRAAPNEHAQHAAHAGHTGHAAGHGPQTHDPFDAHLRGMWLAFALTSALIAYFVTRLTEQLTDARSRALRAERVAALASMAAGTSHQLGTPLSSILLTASEMQRALQKQAPLDHLQEDVALIADQARRCRTILDAMLAEAGEMVGEAPTDTDAEQLLSDAVAGLPGSQRQRIMLRCDPDLPPLHLPARVVAQALQNLVQNAIDASPAGAPVLAGAQAVDGGSRVVFWVRDRGMGISPEQAAEAMEPFVSTKGEAGHGLGLFLARALSEQLGGHLSLERAEGGGTMARFEVRARVVR